MSTLICTEEAPHEKHLVEVVLAYPCSGPEECGIEAEHDSHRKEMTMICPGVTKRAWEFYE